MNIVPLSPIASQVVRVSLNSQPCTISLYEKSAGLFLDLLVNDSPIITGRLCQNGVRLVQDTYLGFAGDLAFLDTSGTDDPTSAELGSRFILTYIDPT